MNEKVLSKLEFDYIQRRLADHATSMLGKQRCLELVPIDDLEEIRALQDETAEAVSMIFAHGNPPLGAIYDSSEHIKLALIGGVLTPRKLLEIADTLRSARRMKGFLSGKSESFPIIASIGAEITTHEPFEKRIEYCILGENSIADHASSNLNRIRRQIEKKQSAVRDRLNALISSAEYQKYLQDTIITIRNDRFVVPVKAEHRSSVSGLIHDQSAKGSTLYIEPLAVVQLNNELKSLALEEEEEIRAILRELTGEAAAIGPQVLANTEVMTRIDFIFAKGKLAVEQNASEPEMNEDLAVRIRNGRHPMIDPNHVVPTNVWLGREFTTLLVTGPNTGGKTVTLKTVGLLCLMAQSGLHVPADHGTQMTVFDEVFADIGDEQSIAQSLSTFSSHMTNIVEILRAVTPRSLVLFDELGAGTDPTEGAALAISILEHLRVRRIRTIATTHYAELKQYALTTGGVENASVEFDVETLSPTYRLLVGIPGKSNAFEISRKLGLSAAIIDSAKSSLTTQDIQFEDVLSKAQESRRIAELERDEAIRIRLESEKIKKRLDEKEARWLEQKEKVQSRAREEAREILRRAKEDADELQRQLRRIRESSSLSEIEKSRKRVAEQIDQLRDRVLDHDAHNEGVTRDLETGDRVMVLTIRQEGTVSAPPNDKGEVEVVVGSLKMKLRVSQVAFLGRADRGAAGSFKPSLPIRSLKSASVRSEIDVRGQNIDEAVATLDKYIDEVLSSSLDKVRIIHGKGTGALRKGLHEYFAAHPHVAHFELAAYNEGGAGATVITVK